jgi:hypothetical protein
VIAPELVLVPALPADALSPITIVENAATKANLNPIIAPLPLALSPCSLGRKDIGVSIGA